MKPYSAKSIKNMSFKTYPFTGEWLGKYGCPEVGFNSLWYGKSGSGKSTEVLRFCNYLANNYGKVLFNSCEERIGLSIQQKLEKHQLDSSKLLFFDNLTYEQLLEVASKRGYKFVVIDSIQQMKFTNDQYADFTKRFGKKRSLLLISKVNGKGKVRGGDEMLHNVDVKVQVDAGVAHIRSRFLEDGYRKIRLFGEEPTPKPKQGSLFNH